MVFLFLRLYCCMSHIYIELYVQRCRSYLTTVKRGFESSPGLQEYLHGVSRGQVVQLVGRIDNTKGCSRGYLHTLNLWFSSIGRASAFKPTVAGSIPTTNNVNSLK